MAIYLRRATMDDVSKIMEIIQDAKQFLKDDTDPKHLGFELNVD